MAAEDVPLVIMQHRLRVTNDLENKFKIIDEMKSIIGIGIGIGIYPTFQHKAVQYNIIYNSDMSAPFCCYTYKDL